jgi:hypothetical protein
MAEVRQCGSHRSNLMLLPVRYLEKAFLEMDIEQVCE